MANYYTHRDELDEQGRTEIVGKISTWEAHYAYGVASYAIDVYEKPSGSFELGELLMEHGLMHPDKTYRIIIEVVEEGDT